MVGLVVGLHEGTHIDCGGAGDGGVIDLIHIRQRRGGSTGCEACAALPAVRKSSKRVRTAVDPARHVHRLQQLQVIMMVVADRWYRDAVDSQQLTMIAMEMPGS